jgi:hypothetical protein
MQQTMFDDSFTSLLGAEHPAAAGTQQDSFPYGGAASAYVEPHCFSYGNVSDDDSNLDLSASWLTERSGGKNLPHLLQQSGLCSCPSQLAVLPAAVGPLDSSSSGWHCMPYPSISSTLPSPVTAASAAGPAAAAAGLPTAGNFEVCADVVNGATASPAAFNTSMATLLSAAFILPTPAAAGAAAAAAGPAVQQPKICKEGSKGRRRRLKQKQIEEAANVKVK